MDFDQKFYVSFSLNQKGAVSLSNKILVNKKKYVLIGGGILLLLAGLVLLVVSIVQQEKPKDPSLIKTLESDKGYIRQVGREEYDFYAALVKREGLEEDLSEEEMDSRVKEYINTVNATFFLGNRLGLCEPYSFQGLQIQMQHENDTRKIKKEKGEPIYGLEQFDLTSYYQYVMSNLEIDLVDYLVEHANGALLEQAKTYFDEDPEAYREMAGITYNVTQDGQTTQQTIRREEFRTLQNQDGELADFLGEAAQGDVFTYEAAGSERKVEVISIEYQDTTFEESKSVVLRDYIQKRVYGDLIATIADNNPVEFDLN